MTEEVFKALGASAPSTGDGATSEPQKQIVIVDPDGIAFLRQLLEELSPEDQNVIILQDDIELEARNRILENYSNIVIELLEGYKKELGISAKEEILSNFEKNWKEIFEKQKGSFSSSICDFCKKILKSTKEESVLKEFIDKTFWPKWANAVTSKYINEKPDGIIVLAPKVAGNSDGLKAFLASNTSFSYLYTGEDFDTHSISYLMREYTNKETGVTGPFALTSGKFSNHVKKFFDMAKEKGIDIENKNIHELLECLNEDKNEKSKEEIMEDFQKKYLMKEIIDKRREAIQAAIKQAGIASKVKPLAITNLPELSPKHENVLAEGVRKTVLPKTQTRILGN